MPAKAGKFRDVLFTTDQAGTLRTWLNNSGWRGWDASRNWFHAAFVGALVVGSGSNRIVYLRMLQKDWDDLVALNPPGATFTVYAQADPRADISFIDPDDPDFRARVMQRRSVFWKVKADAAKVARIRQFWNRSQPDSEGTLRDVGLMFKNFGDDFDDVAGNNE